LILRLISSRTCIGIKLEGFENYFLLLLNEFTVLYNPISVVEAKWIILRSMREQPDQAVRFLEAF
jgi:hypothetical protein